jgi:hypothetical protein
MRGSLACQPGQAGAAVGRVTGPLTAAQPTGLSGGLLGFGELAVEVSTEGVTA